MKRKRTKAKKHVHVTLPSGAIAKVAPNCPRKTLKALDQMMQHVKNVAEFNPPKNWGKLPKKWNHWNTLQTTKNEALDAAIERGERLDKIAEMLQSRKWTKRRSFDPDPDIEGIYRLAKGIK